MRQLKKTYKGHEYVDLDLPSGLKWAICNVGAKTPYESGKYFMWGDVEGRYSNEIELKPCNGDTTPWGEDNPPMNVLDAEHDAVTVNWGCKWRMPTKEDLQELKAYTNSSWEENFNDSGVNGRKFTSMKDPSKYIFIPAVGYTLIDTMFSVGCYCFIWSSGLDILSPNTAWNFYFDCNLGYQMSNNHSYGFSVRGVLE